MATTPRAPAMASPLPPAEALRQHLLQGRGRLLVVLATGLVWAVDALLVRRIEGHHLVNHSYSALLSAMEQLSTLAFLGVTLGLAIALYRAHHRSLLRWSLGYLMVAMVQVVANVVSMVGTATGPKGDGLASLWDVGAVYMESVIVFTFIYVFLDLITPGGAFVWPSRDDEPAPMPHLIDYLFISLNVNSTYGPTSEALVSRPAKLFMALQVLLAILMLTVLIARTVNA